MHSPNYISTKRMFRNMWKNGDEQVRRDAVEQLLHVSYYELSNETPEKQLWS